MERVTAKKAAPPGAIGRRPLAIQLSTDDGSQESANADTKRDKLGETVVDSVVGAMRGGQF
jgi:hypothetical protein